MQFPNIKNLQGSQLIVAFFALILVAVPLGIIWPNARQMQRTATAIYHEYSFLEERNRRGHDIRRAARDYAQVAPHLDDIRALALMDGDELELITAIEALAESSSVTAALQLSPSEGAEKYRRLPIKLQVSGDYMAVLRYISSLRNLAMTLSFNNITIITTTPSPAPPVGTASAGYVEARLTGFVPQTVRQNTPTN